MTRIGSGKTACCTSAKESASVTTQFTPVNGPMILTKPAIRRLGLERGVHFRRDGGVTLAGAPERGQKDFTILSWERFGIIGEICYLVGMHGAPRGTWRVGADPDGTASARKGRTRVMTRRRWATVSRAGIVLAAAFAYQAAASLGWNVDFDNRGAPPEVGGGLPSDLFGAASGQAGRWNGVPATAGGIWPLVDVFGNANGVQYHGEGMSGFGGGYNDPYNVGDYRLLMNDSTQISTHNWFFLTGVPNGRYQVWTYAASVSGRYVPFEIWVSGAAAGQNPQVVTGPAPPNQFEYLVTHGIHDIEVTDGTIRWDLINDPFIIGANVNGFQVVPIPEPASLIAMGGALAALLIRKGRFRPRRTKEQ
ncbi:PEP-CTERM sorting domain-containing protein, partial [Fimbriimonadia bacterium ATM]|nr:PEP-CTERM sorting domain-containing protein [Fimbriimonadia bacterium ATM]